MLRADSSLFKKILCLCLLLILTVNLTVSFDSRAEGEDDLYFGALNESIAQNVKTAVVEKGEFFINGAVQGSLEFGGNNMVFCDIHEGTVHFKEFLVNQGAVVKKGDPLVRISIEVDAIEKEEVELNLEAARKNLEEYITDTKTLLNEYKRASQEGSDKDRKLAQLSYERLEATFKSEVEKREDRIDEFSLRLDEIEELAGREFIYAPSDGVIGFTNRMRNDEVITPWSWLCVINDPSNVRVVVQGGSPLLRYNMPVKLVQTNGGVNTELTGRVITLKSSAYSVNLIAQDDVVEIYGDTTKFRPGTDVSVRFDKVYVPDALVVPQVAVKSDKKGSYLNVFIDGFASKRYVVIGGADGSRSWVVSGVREGDVIILE